MGISDKVVYIFAPYDWLHTFVLTVFLQYAPRVEDGLRLGRMRGGTP